MYPTVLHTGRDIIHRYEGNPLISIEDMPFRCSAVWNAGIVFFENQYLLLMTVETLEGLGSIFLATSKDGIHFFIDSKPFITVCEHCPYAQYDIFSIRDPRITQIDGIYYITCLVESENGFMIALAKTKDFKTVTTMELVTEPDTKSGALFSRKIGNRFALLSRPNDGGGIWISYSDDLVYWGHSVVLMIPRGGFWDSSKIGVACPPIEIDQGWLLIYYGEKETSAGPLFRLGAALLDAEDPSRVIARSNIPILSPRENYERIGNIRNLVFSCGALFEENRILKIYYGASDSCICLGTVELESILRVCHQSGEDY